MQIKTIYKCFNQLGDIPTLNGGSLKLENKFLYLGRIVLFNWKWHHYTPSEGMDCYQLVIDQMEVRPIQSNKTQFLPSSSYVNSVVKMHHIDADKTQREKARRELHKNTTTYIEQILETTSHETAVLRPPTSYLWNHLNKTNRACGTQLEKQRQTHKWRSPMNPFTWTCQCSLTTRTYKSSVRTQNVV